MFYSGLSRLKKELSDPEYLSGWIYLSIVTLYIWSQSMMYIFEYFLNMQIAVAASRLLFIFLCFHLVSIWSVRLPKHTVSMAFLYISLIWLYGLLEFELGNGDQLLKGVLKTTLVILLMLQIISIHKSLGRFLILNCIFGVVAVLLNTIPLLDILGFIKLHSAPITRIGGELLRPDLDPVSYGIFGLIENHVDAGNHFPRLQGWSSEPQNWAFLIFYVLGFCVLQINFMKNKKIILPLLFVVCIHFLFIGSTAGVISFLAVLAGFICIVGLDRVDFKLFKLKPWVYLGVFILIPGLLIPFGLGAIKFIATDFLHLNMMGEGRNWIQKISFINYGSELYTRPIPLAGDGLHSTHNFILNTYLDFGYLFLMPLIFFFYRFFRYVDFMRSYVLLLAASFWLISVTLLGSRGFFLPISGAFFMTLIGLGIYGHPNEHGFKLEVPRRI